jgi:hypothetical protein
MFVVVVAVSSISLMQQITFVSDGQIENCQGDGSGGSFIIRTDVSDIPVHFPSNAPSHSSQKQPFVRMRQGVESEVPILAGASPPGGAQRKAFQGEYVK